MNILDIKKDNNILISPDDLTVTVKGYGKPGDMVCVEFKNEKTYLIVNDDGFTFTIPESELQTEIPITISNMTGEVNKKKITVLMDVPPLMTLEYVEPVAEVKTTFNIDPETRTIQVPESETLFGVFSDRNVERKYFKCPKIVGDNIDLSKCEIFINYVSVGNIAGQYHCTDVAVSGSDITFSWLLSGNLFDKNVSGSVTFAMQAKNAKGQNVFNTTKAIGMVKDTVEASDYVEEAYADVILQLITRVEILEQTSGTGGGGATSYRVIAENVDVTDAPKKIITDIKGEHFYLNEVVFVVKRLNADDGKYLRIDIGGVEESYTGNSYNPSATLQLFKKGNTPHVVTAKNLCGNIYPISDVCKSFNADVTSSTPIQFQTNDRKVRYISEISMFTYDKSQYRDIKVDIYGK